MGGVIYTLIGLVTDITSSHVMLNSLSPMRVWLVKREILTTACVIVRVKWLLYPSRKIQSGVASLRHLQ